MKKALYFLMATPLLLGLAAAHAQVAGGQGVAHGWCLTEDAALRMAESVRTRGTLGVTETLRDPGIECYSSRIHAHVLAAPVTLVSLEFEVVDPVGAKVQFWTGHDINGKFVYTWTPAPDQGA